MEKSEKKVQDNIKTGESSAKTEKLLNPESSVSAAQSGDGKDKTKPANNVSAGASKNTAKKVEKRKKVKTGTANKSNNSAEKTDIEKAGKIDAGKTDIEKAGKMNAGKTDIEKAGKMNAGKTDIEKAGKMNAGKTDIEKAGKINTGKTDIEKALEANRNEQTVRQKKIEDSGEKETDALAEEARQKDALMKKRDTGEDILEEVESAKKSKKNRKDRKKAVQDIPAYPKKTDLPKKKKVRILPVLLGFLLVAGCLGVGVYYFYQKSYYTNRWYENTLINDVDVSGKSFDESKNMLLEKMGNYSLVIKGRDNGSMTINGNDVDYQFSFTEEFDELFKKQHQKFSLIPKTNEYSTEFDISYNEKRLKKLLNHSDFIKGSKAYPVVKPVSAKLKYSKKKERYVCIEEVIGNKLKKSRFLAVVEESLKKAVSNLDITDETLYPDMYAAPKVTSKNRSLRKKMKKLNYAISRYVVWNMGEGVTEKITPTELAQWCTYEDGEVHYDETKLAEWVENFCKKYKTTDKERKVKMHNKKVVTVQAGDYGWQMDYDKTLEQAKEGLDKKIKSSVIKAYLEEPSAEHKKALTFKKKVFYLNTAYKKDYDNFMNDYDPENYTEVSLQEQMIYVIRNGKVAFSCRCISGRPTPERSTKPGAYFIKEHQPHRVLRGADYETPVDNWVRITWTGTGFHRAEWQRWGSWSPTYYLTRGSHGCLNLSTEDSKSIYDLVQYKEAVFIY